MCQKGVQALAGQFENEFGSTSLPTLAGQVGLGDWLASWSPNQLDLWGLVLATNQVGKHLSFSSTPWVIKFWKMLTFWKIGLWLFFERCPIWPMFYGSSCMVRCQKGVQALGGQFENEFGSTILPTLAGQVGLGDWLASWSPNQLDLRGLVLATNQVGKHLSFSSTPWVIKFWKCWHFEKIGLWLCLKDVQSDPCFMGQVAWWGVRKGHKPLVVKLKMKLDVYFCPAWLVKLD